MTDKDVTLRVARPTDKLDEVVRFYSEGLGLTVLASFRDHDGFDGTMLGRPGAVYHLEFTRKRGHTVDPAPTQENLLVFYRGSLRSLTGSSRAVPASTRSVVRLLR